LIYPSIFSPKAIARTVIAEWIEVFYNRQRMHSTIGYLSPVQLEEDYWSALDLPMAA
jgi:putative transposase